MNWELIGTRRLLTFYPGEEVVWRMYELGTHWYPTPMGILPRCGGCFEASVPAHDSTPAPVPFMLNLRKCCPHTCTSCSRPCVDAAFNACLTILT